MAHTSTACPSFLSPLALKSIPVLIGIECEIVREMEDPSISSSPPEKTNDQHHSYTYLIQTIIIFRVEEFEGVASIPGR